MLWIVWRSLVKGRDKIFLPVFKEHARIMRNKVNV